MQLSKLANIVGGQLIGKDTPVNNISINGKQIKANDCYIALIGDRLDGHQFIGQAIQHGATATIVSCLSSIAIPQILVEDTLVALTRLAKFHRQQFKIPTFALTGSCGKTTIKEMLKSILPKTAFTTPGNLNNHIGVPLSLLKLNKTHTHAIFELGANHIGEIDHTTSLVQPDAALISLIAPAHIEGFGSIEGVAQAKGEIFSGLSADGIAVVNLDDPRVLDQSENHQGKKLSYSMQQVTADVYATNIKQTKLGCYQWQLNYQNNNIAISMQVPGKHNVNNALAAASTAIAMGIDLDQIKQGLEAFESVDKRLCIKLNAQGTRLIDDSYNANLSSVKAAIDVLAEFSGKRIFVLGELAEAGDELEEHYQNIGNYARQKHIEAFYSCGDKSTIAQKNFGQGGKHFNNKQLLLKTLGQELDDNTTMLVKGSRSAGMEYIIQQLS